MLILGTLIVTWIAHNWWKLLLLIVGVIVVHEYVLYKKRKEAGTDAGKETKDAEDTDTEDTEETGLKEEEVQHENSDGK